MHYKNGTPAKIGDQVLFETYAGLLVTGHVTKTQAGATTCNLQVSPIGAPLANQCVTASECVRADEALAAFDKVSRAEPATPQPPTA